MGVDRGKGRFAFRTTLIYVLAAATWIVVSDTLLADELGNIAFSFYSIGKGLLFVAVTGALLFGLLWQAESQLYLKSSALEAAANAIVIADVNGVIEWVNPAFSALTGYSADEAAGQPTSLLRSGVHSEQFYKQLWETVLAGQVWHSTLVNRRKDGSLYDEEQTITPVRSPNGAIIRFIAVKQDVSERRRHERELLAANRALAEAYDATIAGWAQALDLRDRETYGHSRRVTAITVALAQAMGFSEAEIVHVRRGALLHDIGKMGVSDAILLKPGPLNDDEWRQMRMHPVFSRDLLAKIDFLRPALDIPVAHHERWDGRGYPVGMRGEQIPLAARIFAVVDVWDALTNDRPYRSAWPAAKARDYIAQHAGIHFDPAVVAVFMASIDEWMDANPL